MLWTIGRQSDRMGGTISILLERLSFLFGKEHYKSKRNLLFSIENRFSLFFKERTYKLNMYRKIMNPTIRYPIPKKKKYKPKVR